MLLSRWLASGLFRSGVLLLCVASVAQAQGSECVADRYGKVICPPARTICAPEPISGAVQCSPAEGGVIITGGCVPAQAARCTPLTR